MKTILARLAPIAVSLSVIGVQIAHAQTTDTVGSKISAFLTFLSNDVVPLIFAVAFIVFLWGVFNFFILGGGNDEKQTEGRTFIIYAVIGFVIMVCIWGIVRVIDASLGLSGGEPPLPTLNGGTSGGTNTNPQSPSPLQQI